MKHFPLFSVIPKSDPMGDVISETGEWVTAWNEARI